jgi:hypothetical protein
MLDVLVLFAVVFGVVHPRPAWSLGLSLVLSLAVLSALPLGALLAGFCSEAPTVAACGVMLGVCDRECGVLNFFGSVRQGTFILWLDQACPLLST